jgi:hypothetical protein
MKRHGVLVLLVSLPALALCCEVARSQDISVVNPVARRWSVKQLVEFHLSIKKDVQVQDIYKMLYQANFGVEHLLGDTAGVARYLEEELASLATAPSDEPLVERISTSDQVVRVNLRPFKRLNLEPARLVECMFQSAAETKPDTLVFLREWNEFAALVRYRLVDLPSEQLQEWSEKVESGAYGPAHHTDAYRAANSPAYRVVRRAVFERMFPLVESVTQ